MTYKHDDWYCKPKNEEEAREIVERAVASGAKRVETVGQYPSYPWNCSASWGVTEGVTFTCDADEQYSSFFGAQEYTIEQVRLMFPLPTPADWSEAPHDAQFYSSGAFRKQESGEEYRWEEGTWKTAYKDSLAWHEEQPDFEFRPE